MTLIFIILPITLAIAVGFVAAFAWATRRGQFDDLTTPGYRMLFNDEDAAQPPPTHQEKSVRKP